MNAVKTSWRSRVGDGVIPTPAEVITGGPGTSGAVGNSAHGRRPPVNRGRDAAVPLAHFVVFGVGNIAVVDIAGLGRDPDRFRVAEGAQLGHGTAAVKID
ncbi:hypothetical protein [Streptomyces parvus]|uniref:hypothetical protein n=1 Tax=Streptomyces parvus TaxID=66428 RepID=UPI00371C3B8D